jgi:hypothetical protein
VGFTVPHIIWILMNFTYTHCALQNAASSRGHVRWQANLGRNDKRIIDVRKLAHREAIDTGTDSTTSQKGLGQQGHVFTLVPEALGCLYFAMWLCEAYTCPWSLGMSLLCDVFVRAFGFSCHVICSIPWAHRVAQRRLTHFRTQPYNAR